jgi:hypothetical protein
MFAATATFLLVMVSTAMAQYRGGLPGTIWVADDARAFDAFAQWLHRFETAAVERHVEGTRVTIAAPTAPVSRELLAEGAYLPPHVGPP